MEATTKDLRLHTRELIAATERGETVIITFRGKARAMLTPLEGSAVQRPERNPAFGLWAGEDHHDTNSIDAQVRILRQPRRFD
jgi:antitoxin (DNA-binding transcriptional repressor) of toxin-antitoxin stability system